MVRKTERVQVKPSNVTLTLANKTIKHPYEVVEDVVVQVNKHFSIKLRDIGDSKEDAFAARVSLFYKKRVEIPKSY